MHPYLTRYAIRNCNQPLDYVKSKRLVREFLTACLVLPILWLAMMLMGDPRD